ncbi:farnesyl-diphosphate farnesyltransferase [Basidiobolus meristosporus CBS 931.73]|uniref:Squalene synthase n=1 Tax=Basidiobolus meristosporus CBS 931.73 TaxID=1314790 RepID=A0A1Y1YDE5_9FUNG|nr:farnesyl-diphosphate farnesyltransferase [Basidiobolus meristosporus CBS 931.73]|eukprot:ORX95756.1 farnesyl-diphosphate farnesyltransferase [Basidiobolus meristosporus CBS 931.73]
MGLLESVFHPSELVSIVKFFSHATPKPQEYARPTLFTCYDFLEQTSRSFASVIKELDDELRDAVCIFYLVLRGLDTIEDDMSIPNSKKLPLLRSFHEIIYLRGWNFTENDSEEKDRLLLVQFDTVIEEFLTLKEEYQDVIKDITQRMGNGMADFCDKRVSSTDDYNLYCHYVAGLVGIGLSKLFAASGLEDSSFGDMDELSNSMGLFLQKTNIIRDFYEDLLDGRTFWPKDIYGQYVQDLGDLPKPENKDKALACLNHMCLDALSHVTDSLDYMSRIRNQTIFNFCAIPQVMAVATIAEVFNNYNVFSRNVKIRKGLAIRLIYEANSMENVRSIFQEFMYKFVLKNNAKDPNYIKISQTYGKVLQYCETNSQLKAAVMKHNPMTDYIRYAAIMIFIALVYQYCQSRKENESI